MLTSPRWRACFVAAGAVCDCANMPGATISHAAMTASNVFFMTVLLMYAGVCMSVFPAGHVFVSIPYLDGHRAERLLRLSSSLHKRWTLLKSISRSPAPAILACG